MLHRMLRTGVAKCMVHVGANNPDIFAAWAAVLTSSPNHVVFAYSKPAARRIGLMTGLLGALGCDTTQTLHALFASPAARGMKARGWKIEFVDEEGAPDVQAD